MTGIIKNLKIYKDARAFKNKFIQKLRKTIYQRGVNKTDLILEVGPSHNPLFPKRKGWNVEIIDRLDQDGLKEHYKNDGVDLNDIEYVDYVWNGKSYVDSIKKENVYDYIIASHVIEHTTNLVGFLNDCSKLLKDEGCLRLVIPDRRYTFDHFRVVTGLGEVLNNYYYDDTINSPGIVGEYMSSVVSYKGKILWKRKHLPFANYWMDGNIRKYSFIHSDDVALDWMDDVLKKGEYKDVHHYVFTTASFEYLIYELRQLGLIDLEIEKSLNIFGNEFMVDLRKKTADPVEDNRKKMRLLNRRNKESRIII